MGCIDCCSTLGFRAPGFSRLGLGAWAGLHCSAWHAASSGLITRNGFLYVIYLARNPAWCWARNTLNHLSLARTAWAFSLDAPVSSRQNHTLNPTHTHSNPCPQVLLLSLLDLPFSISPVVTGLMLTLLYGRSGWFAEQLAANGLSIVFAFPGGRGQGLGF